MKPEMKGTLVDTDVEVELDNSEEMKKKMEQTSSSSSSSFSSSSNSISSSGGGTVFSGANSSSSSMGNRKVSSQTVASSISSSGTMPAQGQGLGSFAEVPRLPAEPAPGEINVIHVRVKTPTGTLHHETMV